MLRVCRTTPASLLRCCQQLTAPARSRCLLGFPDSKAHYQIDVFWGAVRTLPPPPPPAR